MKYLIVVVLCLSSCVRVPEDYHVILEKRIESNERVLELVAETPDNAALRTTIEQNNDVLRSTVGIIRGDKERDSE